MRSYALFLALAVLSARAATIPAPQNEKKLPTPTDALDDVSLDNNESEQELVNPVNTVKDVENKLRNSIPEIVPVKIVEEQPIIKTVSLKEDSNDYVPDNDDSSNIKRVEIDLKNPGPPQRQEHDSQKPAAYHSYIDNERAVAAIKQSIAESQNIFTRGIQDVTQKFKYYFANNEDLDEVSKNIQSLRQNFDAEVIKLGNTINSYLKPNSVGLEGSDNVEVPADVKEVENRLKSLETNFNNGVGMLSEGVELLSILKEEDDQNLKISGKAENENVATPTGTSTGTAPANPPAGSNPSNPLGFEIPKPLNDFFQNFNNTVVNSFTTLQSQIQNFFNPASNQNQNQTPSLNNTNQGGFNPINFIPGITNFFQGNPTPNQQQQQQQGTAPAGAQSDDPGTTERPNILQQFSNTIQGFLNPTQGSQQPAQPNPISQFWTGINQGISNLIPGRPQQTTQQPNQATTASGQAAADTPVAAQGTNSVPAAPAQVQPAQAVKQPETESAPVQNAPVATVPAQSDPIQSGPIQQIGQNNPIVKGLSNAIQKIQGISNSNDPKATVIENTDSKGHGGANNGDSISGVVGIKSAPIKDEPETIPKIQDGGEFPADVK